MINQLGDSEWLNMKQERTKLIAIAMKNIKIKTNVSTILIVIK